MWIDVLKGKLRHWLADCGAGAGLATGGTPHARSARPTIGNCGLGVFVEKHLPAECHQPAGRAMLLDRACTGERYCPNSGFFLIQTEGCPYLF